MHVPQRRAIGRSLSSSKRQTLSPSLTPNFSCRYLTTLPLPDAAGKKSNLPKFIAQSMPSGSCAAITARSAASTAGSSLVSTRKQP